MSLGHEPGLDMVGTIASLFIDPAQRLVYLGFPILGLPKGRMTLVYSVKDVLGPVHTSPTSG